MMTNSELKVSRCIQQSIEMVMHPFREIADRAGMTEAGVLETIRGLIDRGLIRKFSAIVRHREAGFTANAMVIWAVPEHRCEEAGRKLSFIPEISHCYERTPAFEGKYTLFSMIHLKHRDIEQKVEAISRELGIQDYQILTSEEEFKKDSMTYFP